MGIKRVINYAEYGDMVSAFAQVLKNSKDKFSAVYGLPRGGLPIAVHISHKLNIPLISNLMQFNHEFKSGILLVVDDIIDTGKTYDRFIEFANIQNIKFYSATIFYKPCSEYIPNLYIEQTEDWIVFPWEDVIEKPSKYHQKIYSDIFDDNDDEDCQDQYDNNETSLFID